MKKFFKLFLILILVTYLTVNFSFAEDYYCTYNFTKNFQYNDEDEDIFELQKFLNSDSRSVITRSGAGSPGNETNYFGNSTSNAVREFQKIVSLRQTGIFDDATRSAINKICLENKKYFEKNGLPIPGTTSSGEDLKIILSSDEDYFLPNKLLKVYLESGVPIKNPTESSLIVDGAKIMDIRKLAQTKYVIYLTPNEQAKKVYVQVEAEQIFSNSNQKNSEASNSLELNLYIQPTLPVNTQITQSSTTQTEIELPAASTTEIETVALPPESFPGVTKDVLIKHLKSLYNKYKLKDLVSSKNQTTIKKYGIYQPSNVFNLNIDPCGPAKSFSPEIFNTGSSIGTLQVIYQARNIYCSTNRSLVVPFPMSSLPNPYAKIINPFTMYAGYRNFDSMQTQKFPSQRKEAVKELQVSKMISFVDKLTETKNGYVVLNRIETLPASCNSAQWNNETKFDRNLLKNEKLDCKQIFSYNSNTIYALNEESDKYDFIQIRNKSNKAVKLLAYPKINYDNRSCFTDKPLESRYFPNGLFCCKNYPCNAIENMEPLTYKAENTTQQIKMIYTTERTNIETSCSDLPKQSGIVRCPEINRESGAYPTSAYTVKLKY